MKKIVFNIFIVILLAISFAFPAIASKTEGTKTYEDYLFILVHGINGGAHHFNGTDHKDPKMKLLQYLENNLGLKGRVFAYSFTEKNGSSWRSVREFGDRNYRSASGYKCWLDRAKVDFKRYYAKNHKEYEFNESRWNEVPDSLVPSKYIVLTHSMGNMPVRLYIYSKELLGKNLYQDDIAKVVFIAPPFTGSDLAYFALIPKTLINTMIVKRKYDMLKSWAEKAGNPAYNFLLDPYSPYKVAKEACFVLLDSQIFFDYVGGLLGTGGRKVDPVEGGGYGYLDLGTWELIPELWHTQFGKLLNVRLDDPAKEPAYSVIYGKGSPVLDLSNSTKNKIFSTLGKAVSLKLSSFIDAKNYVDNPRIDFFDNNLSSNIASFFDELGPEIETLMPGSNFYDLPTSQAKFISLVMSNPLFTLTDDGDSAVPVHSAKGIFKDRIGTFVGGRETQTKHLANANFYSKTFKSRFNDFLDKNFPDYVEGAAVLYGSMVMFGVPSDQALAICQWALTGILVKTAIDDRFVIWDSFLVHTNTWLKEYKIIETALLDTPAIFTVQDIQTTTAASASATSETTAALSITAPRAPPSGFESLKIKSIKEDRAYKGNQNMSIPITIDGDRKYVNEMVFTKPPLRIEGKLNYLIPARMKQFQYSFNFAAWKDIKNVDPKTGEFVLDKLPFAEGQNVLAIRAINAVDVSSHQICKFIVNTIPMVVSEMKPEPNTYTNNNKTTISGEFNKSVYSTNTKVGEGIPDITSAELHKDGKLYLNLLNDSNFKEQNIKINDYKTVAKFTYTPSSPLPDGEYKIIVKSKSSVGASQGIWSFWIDTTPPSIKIATLEAYSARAPTTIKYTVSDDLAVQLKNITCYLTNSNGKYITQIATADSVSKGDHFFTWDGKRQTANGLRLVPDGTYHINVKVYDQAGNNKTTKTPIIIDSSAPKVTSADFTPKTMTSISNQQTVTVKVSEPSTVFIKMKNVDTGTTNVFLAKTASVGGQWSAVYSWNYSNQFSSGLKDGLYDVEITAQDSAGNESVPLKISSIRVDRTSPTIYAQAAVPYVLSNSGASKYTTTLSYNLSDDASNVTVKIYNESTGALIKTFSNATTSITWKADSSIPAGAYQFKIIAEDKFGNLAIAYASCVKDGIAPVITFPSENSDLSGVVAIKGTAIDPDWTNDKPFERYLLFYAYGKQLAPLTANSLGPEWKSDFIEVPAVSRKPGAVSKNEGIRPMQGNSTLGYFYTTGLKNNQYTLLVVVEEKGGMKVASTRTINVYNDPQEATDTPYIKLMPVASSIDYSDDSKKLSIGFINSVKPANVNVEVVKTAVGGLPSSVVFYKRFPNVAGAPFIGEPTYEKTKDLGYFIWKDVSGTWHIEWSHDGKIHNFSGNIVAMGGNLKVISNKQLVTSNGSILSWDTKSSGGFSFTVDSNTQQIMITPKIDEDPKSPQIYASNVYLGVAKKTVSYLPIMIDVKNNSLANLANGLQLTANGGYNPFSSGCEWDGKLDTGSYADSGDYIVRVRAEGTDGFGLSTDEAKIKIKTPFEVTDIKVTPENKRFYTLGLPDRISVFYNVSKDSNVSAYVYDYSKNLIATLFENKKVLGTAAVGGPRSSVVWKGNYPDPKSGAIVTGGNYLIKLIIAAKDGSGTFTKELSGIKVEETFKNENYAKLDQIGDVGVYQGAKAQLAEGESPYYFEAKGSGYYYPPRDFSYRLTANGLQRFTMYPYVPYAGLMHRGFKQVDVRAKITYRVHYHHYEGYVFLAGEKWGDDSYTESNEKTISLTENKFTFHDEKICYPRGDRGSVTRIEASVEVFAARDKSLLLDYSDWTPIDTKGILTEKGMFRLKFDYGVEKVQKIGYGLGTGAVNKDLYTYRAKADLELEERIPYSRLTNRFIPWFGFVNKNNPQTKDFTSYLANIETGLGFPGKIFFKDPDAKPGEPYNTTPAKVAASLSGKTWKEKIAEFNKLAKQANVKGYKGSMAASVGFDSYLSKEYFEFIPITAPAGKDFEKINNTTYSAKTGVVSKTFVFDWPNPDTSITTWGEKYGLNGTNYNDLIGSGSIDNPEFAQKWDGYGREENICFYELDMAEVNKSKNDAKASVSLSGKTIYDKSDKKSSWQSAKLLGELLPVSDKIEDIKYGASSNDSHLRVDLLGDSRTGKVYVEDQTLPQSWSTEDDNTLLIYGGKVQGASKLFNDKDFRGRGYINIFPEYNISEDFTSKSALKYTFLKKDLFGRDSGINIDNPNLEISSWKVDIFDKRKEKNNDLIVEKVEVNNKDHKKDFFVLKLDPKASENRFVEINGSVSTPYELIYFDGDAWRNIARSSSGRSGHLAWWNVSRLNGKYTVLLRTGSYISTQDINIGTLVKNGEEKNVFSAYRRAQLSFPSGAFKSDQLVTITPVTMTELKIQNRPVIMTHGPIVEIKPSPYKFDLAKRPTLSFAYTFDDLKAHGYWNGNAATVKIGDYLGLGLNIHQITAAGDLQIVSNNKQSVVQDGNGDLLYVFEAPLDHFSTYTLVDGKFSLSAPIIYADRYITNKNIVNIWGTAEAESELKVFVSKIPLHNNGEGGPSTKSMVGEEIRGSADNNGNFSFKKIKLLQEGKNYIYVVSNPKGDKSVSTSNYIEIEKDTVPPKAVATLNLQAFSPNEDGKWDTITFNLSSNEKGKLEFIITDPNSKPLVTESLSIEANQPLRLAWGKNGFNVYQEVNAGAWVLKKTIYAPYKFPDGYYSYTLFSIDSAGNISNNISDYVIVDTTPPTVSDLLANPNPFTPNNDGIKDSTKLSFTLSEPSYATINILRDDGVLFKKYSKTVGDLKYPSTNNMSSAVSRKPLAGSWQWNGKGARNELIGGTFSYYLMAEDAVGNVSTSDAKTVVIDHSPSLLAYAYAEPDPFSPAQGNATEIKYYLARDNCIVQSYIVGADGKSINNLVFGKIQNKGEHSVKWYGDYLPGYKGALYGKDPSKVADGMYEFKVIAQDADGGKPATLSNTVLVDNTPPTLFVYPIKVDYLTGKAVLKYNIPEPASMEVSVYDVDGKYIKSLYQGQKSSGTYSLEYKNDKTDYKQKYFKLVAEDSAKNSMEKSTELFALNISDSLNIINHTANPAAFTPNADSHTDLTRISYTLTGGVPEYTVTVKILDSANSTIKTIIDDEAQTAGTHSFYWAGETDSKDKTITDGVYQYEITVEDKLGDKTTAKGEILTILSKPTLSISSNTSNFSPNGDSSSDNVLLTYSLSYPSQWITDEASVRIDIKTSTGEAVFSKSFQHSSGTYNYIWDGKDSGQQSVVSGQYYVYINATDALGTPSLTQNIPLTVDYTDPEPSDFSVLPYYAKSGDKLVININFEEVLNSSPDVTVVLANGTRKTANLLSVHENKYLYYYYVTSDDPEGAARVDVSAIDRAGNLIKKSTDFVIDQTIPSLSSYSFSSDPNPASTEEVTINLQFSEILGTSPTVKVTQKNASSVLATITMIASDEYQARYLVVSGYDGTAEVSVEFYDRADNNKLTSINFEVDATAPVFSSLQSDQLFVRPGITNKITFKTSEDLAFNPDVYINDKKATYSSLSNKEYTYEYTVDSTDLNRTATIAVSGEDFAGNIGNLKSDSLSESFTIDTIIPVVVSREVSVGNIVISQPSPFTPNKDNREDTVTVYYTLSEPTYVTVKVYAVTDKWPYTSSDFINYYRVWTLISDQWQSGQQALVWDGSISNNLFRFDKNSNKYVDSGKYAFIVEARDKAGNITERKYGGTVWVQDTILEVEEPDQFSNDLNPDPRIFSPAGTNNSVLYFRVNAGSYPKTWKNPEWISAKAIDENDIDWNDIKVQSKNVGTYTARVYDSNGSLVRTIINGVDVQSATLISVPWDGKNNSGSIVSDGRYKIVVDVTDYSGVTAQYGSPFERWVIIDRTAPNLSALSVSNQYISPNSSQATSTKSTNINYSLSDNFSNITDEANKVDVIIEVYNTSANSIKLQDLTMEVTASLVGKSLSWNGSLPDGTGYVGNSNLAGVYPDGTYTYRITATDLAGNVTTMSASSLVVDTEGPSIAIGGQGDGVWYNGDTDITISLSDQISYQGYRLNWDAAPTAGPSGSNTATTATTKHPSEGTNILYVVAWDQAGNETSTNMTYMRDDSDPIVGVSPENRSWETGNIFVTLRASDEHSGLISSKYVWTKNTNKPGDLESWNDYYNGQKITQSTDGEWYLHLKAEDLVGKTTYSYFGKYQKDNTDPAISASPDHRDWDDENISVTVYGSDAHSGILNRDYAWSKSTATPSSGWTKYYDGETISQTSDGEWYLHLRAEDNVNKTNNKYYGHYKKDNVDPIITPPANATFNPYLNSLPLSFEVSDPSPSSGGLTVTAKIKYGAITIKDLSLSGSYSTSWDGTNNATPPDYVNEGTYTLEIYAEDNAGNAITNKACTITLQDDQRITNRTRVNSTDPYLLSEDSWFSIRWLEGSLEEPLSNIVVTAGGENHDHYWPGPGKTFDSSTEFDLDHAQSVNVSCSTSGDLSGYSAFVEDINGTIYGWATHSLSAGKYWAKVHAVVSSRGALGPSKGYATLTVSNLTDHKYLQCRIFSNDYGENWGDMEGPNREDNHPSRDYFLDGISYNHYVNIEGGNLYYTRLSKIGEWTILGKAKLTNFAKAINPSIRYDSSDNVYVVWQDTRHGNAEIYFQKVPINFAPISGSVSATKISNQKSTAEAKATNAPELISPADGATVTVLRPTFKWKGIVGTTDYSINLGKTTLLTTPDRTFSKSATQNEASPSDGSIPSFAYTIHEFDEGLDRGTWQWQVVSNPSQTNEAKSEIWSFDVDPPLTIAGITNYPNPFNSNIERTKIRYRLGAEADEVTIRIYDITGGLVREIDGTCNSESSSIWGKYNDVEWDGRNDRGDLVLNGIYPYEIVARLGSTSLSGRGKIAVLK